MNAAKRIDFVCEPTPDGVNPYVGEGLAGVPKILLRVMDAPDRLSHEVKQVMFYHGRTMESIASETGLPSNVVREAVECGTGCVDDVRVILENLGIKPMTLPGPPALRARR